MPAREVFTQGNFQGGWWDIPAHGRLDHPWHKSALEVSYNGLPTESGTWTKRSGSQWIAPTYKRLAGVVRKFQSNSGHRYAVVLTTDGTTGWAHFFHNDGVLVGPGFAVNSSSSASGTLTLGLASSPVWFVGDHVVLGGLPSGGGPYLNRWLQISAISGATVSLVDDTGAAFGFDTGANAVAGATAYKVQKFTTGFLGGLSTVQVAQLGAQRFGGPIQALLLHQNYPSQLISITNETSGTLAGNIFSNGDTITMAPATFVNGPYLDAQPGGGTVSAFSGSITFTPSDGTTFVSSDVNRTITLFSIPPAWSSSTAYTYGQNVTYNSAYWEWVGSSAFSGVTNVVPGTLYTTSSGAQVLLWSPAPGAPVWGWGTITAQTGTAATVNLSRALNSANGTTITNWKLGAFTGTNWPRTGFLHEGRLWLGGAREGRIDGSFADTYLTFAPFDTNGNVFDEHAISEYIAGGSQDNIIWFQSDRAGLLIGTVAEEFVLTGGGINDPLTPTNFLFRRMSSYGTAANPSVLASFSTIFVQTQNRSVYEYVTDAFTTAPSGRLLSEFSQELVNQVKGIVDLAYTETKVPVIWAAAGGGQLLSCTYRRTSRFMTSPPDRAGWAVHELANGARSVISVAGVPTPDLEADTLYMTTSTSAAGVSNSVEILRPVWLFSDQGVL